MVVTNSCCCFGLRTGAMIIGWFGLISGIIGMLFCIQGILVHDDFELSKATLENDSLSEHQISLVNNFNEYIFKGLLYRMIGVAIVTILMNTALLWGVYKNNHLMLIPWLLMKALYLGGLFLIMSVMSIGFITRNEVVFGIEILVGGLLGSILPIYIWICIYSLYKRFRLEENQCGNDGLCNKEIGFGVSTPIMDKKPPPYSICDV